MGSIPPSRLVYLKVYMQHDYVCLQLIYVNMQHNLHMTYLIQMHHEYVNMRDKYMTCDLNNVAR